MLTGFLRDRQNVTRGLSATCSADSPDLAALEWHLSGPPASVRASALQAEGERRWHARPLRSFGWLDLFFDQRIHGVRIARREDKLEVLIPECHVKALLHILRTTLDGADQPLAWGVPTP